MKTTKEKGFNKPQKFGELYWLFGVIFVSLGVAICSKADLGVSMIAAPPFILTEAISKHLPFITVGTIEYIFQGFLLILWKLSVL